MYIDSKVVYSSNIMFREIPLTPLMTQPHGGAHLVPVVLYLPVYRLVPAHARPVLSPQMHQVKLENKNIVNVKNRTF